MSHRAWHRSNSYQPLSINLERRPKDHQRGVNNCISQLDWTRQLVATYQSLMIRSPRNQPLRTLVGQLSGQFLINYMQRKMTVMRKGGCHTILGNDMLMTTKR